MFPLTQAAKTMLAVSRRKSRLQDQMQSFLTCFLSDVQQLSLRDLTAPQFFVKMRGAEPIALMYSPDDGTDDIKAAIRNRKGIPPVQQVLSYGVWRQAAGGWLLVGRLQHPRRSNCEIESADNGGG